VPLSVTAGLRAPTGVVTVAFTVSFPCASTCAIVSLPALAAPTYRRCVAAE
jgi:hypothetical protein